MPYGYAMLIRPNKGCHSLGDVVVRIRKVRAIPRSWLVLFSAEIGHVFRAAMKVDLKLLEPRKG